MAIKVSEKLNIPKHIAFIMDGNGRWAQKRGLPRNAGHKEGTKILKKLINDLQDLGVEYATLYAFSTENWSRPKEEVDGLMNLFNSYLDDLDNHLDDNNFRLKFIGDLSRLDKPLRDKMIHYEEGSKNRTGLCVTLAINYGGRNELTNAAKRISELTKEGYISPENVSEELLESMLYTDGIPPVDLLIRTAGEQRLSNFLLWQAAYAEFYFCDTLWPDFGKADVLKAIESYSSRHRKFGGLEKQ